MHIFEMENNAHSQSNVNSFAVTIFLSGQAGEELCLFKKVSQSVSQENQICRFVKFLFLLYLRSQVFLCVATAYNNGHVCQKMKHFKCSLYVHF